MSNIADGELTAIALCWRIERRDGAGIALTSHDAPVLRDGVRHDPAPGVTPAAVSRGLGLEPHSGELAGALSSDALSAEDLTIGRWNKAAVRLAAVDWADSAAEEIVLLRGELGEVTIEGESFAAELQGAAARLNAPVCPATSPECRAEFGDKKCRVDLAGRTIVASVVEADNGELRLDRAIGDAFLLGRLRYLRGANCGVATTILAVDGERVRVRDLPRAPVGIGCRVELREGCDKRFETCVGRFGNAANFRGEPHLPGSDLLTRYPGA
ncbi:MAG TPA: DUF2163 domain-containing protein [Sphingomicrobium sp.]|nr:DUF2163 domain-containing protein [Sphingomicrobium sp.]